MSKFKIWSLYYRQEIIWFVVGFIIGLTIFVKSLPNPWLGYVIAFPYLITVVGMGYSRQAVVIGFSLWC